jgi:uncharacterized membrane protein HdeD (DUF308 family)
MKEIFVKANKNIIYRAVLFALLGLIMIIWPLQIAKVICYVFAGFMTLFGAGFIISYLSKDVINDFFKYDLVYGILLLTGAVCVIVKSETVISFIPFCIGVVVLISGILKLQNAIDMYRIGHGSGAPVLVMALINIAFAIFLIVKPLDSTKIVFILLGVGMLYSGFSDLVSAILFANKSKIILKDIEAIDADYVDVE